MFYFDLKFLHLKCFAPLEKKLPTSKQDLIRINDIAGGTAGGPRKAVEKLPDVSRPAIGT